MSIPVIRGKMASSDLLAGCNGLRSVYSSEVCPLRLKPPWVAQRLCRNVTWVKLVCIFHHKTARFVLSLADVPEENLEVPTKQVIRSPGATAWFATELGRGLWANHGLSAGAGIRCSGWTGYPTSAVPTGCQRDGERRCFGRRGQSSFLQCRLDAGLFMT